MREVLISIQPKWCELIASGKKTVEVRKTKPKIETPFKVYIYCTKGETIYLPRDIFGNNVLNGKVIGEFVCDKIVQFENSLFDEAFIETVARSCVPMGDLLVYIGKQDYGYGWHITDLVVYDKPRELSEFYTEGDCDCMNCKKCYWFDRGNGYNVENDCNLAYQCVELHKSFKPIIRPPQSWCYVEERSKENSERIESV